jgi:hypothetical protein
VGISLHAIECNLVCVVGKQTLQQLATHHLSPPGAAHASRRLPTHPFSMATHATFIRVRKITAPIADVAAMTTGKVSGPARSNA